MFVDLQRYHYLLKGATTEVGEKSNRARHNTVSMELLCKVQDFGLLRGEVGGFLKLFALSFFDKKAKMRFISFFRLF